MSHNVTSHYKWQFMCEKFLRFYLFEIIKLQYLNLEEKF
jgi:hypothetical protein